jgi:hypothetical protein
MMSERDARNAIRFMLELPVSFWWSGPGESVLSGRGHTRNMGRGGVLIASETCPAPGTLIELSILLPPIQGSGSGMRLRCEGAVVRAAMGAIDQAGKENGEFAVAVHWHRERSDAWAEPGRCGEQAAARYCD